MDFRPELSWEFRSGDEIEARGIRAVRNHARHLKEVSPYYREALDGYNVDDITTLDDLRKLPLTDKNTVTSQPDRFTAVAPEQIVETVVTSGSTGKPLIFGPLGRSHRRRPRTTAGEP